MSLLVNQFSFNTEMDALLEKLGDSDISEETINNIQERIDRLNSVYEHEESIGKDRYKLYFAQAIISFQEKAYADARQWLELAWQTYGSEFPDYLNLYNAIDEAYTDEEPQIKDGLTLKLTKHTGLLVAWQSQEFHYQGSPDQLRPFYMKILAHNLSLGWWSTLSLLINPVTILSNWYSWIKYKQNYNNS